MKIDRLSKQVLLSTLTSMIQGMFFALNRDSLSLIGSSVILVVNHFKIINV